MFFKERMNSQGESIRTCAGRFHSEEQRHHCFGIRSIIAKGVIPFECFDESINHAAVLGAVSRSKPADNAQRTGKGYCFSSCIAGTIACESFNGLQCFDISNRFSTLASMTLCAMLALYPPEVAELVITSRSQVLGQKISRALTVVRFVMSAASKPCQQQVVLPHYPVHTFMVDRSAPTGNQLPIKQPLDTPIAVSLTSAQKFDDQR